MGLAEPSRMTRLRPARLLPAIVVFALTAGTSEPEADACSRGPDDQTGFSGLAVASPIAPADVGILVHGNAKGIAADRIAVDLVIEARAGERVVPTEVSVVASKSLGGDLIGFTLAVLPKENLPADTKLTLEAKSAAPIVPSEPLVATIGAERLSDLDSLQLKLVSPMREQVPDASKTATCVLSSEMMASGCGGPVEPERRFQPRFVWAHTARYAVESSWRTGMIGAYTDVSVTVPSAIVDAGRMSNGGIATTATGRVCVDATITLKSDPTRKWTRQACLELAELPTPTAAEQAEFEEKNMGGLKCASIRYADGTSTTPGDAPSGSEDSGCSVGSHAGSSGTTSAFGALVALAMAGVARLRRRR